MLITFEENGLGSLKLALRLILCREFDGALKLINFQNQVPPVTSHGSPDAQKVPSVNNFWRKWTRKFKIGIGSNFGVGNSMIHSYLESFHNQVQPVTSQCSPGAQTAPSVNNF